jgi:phosphate acetyltransferase
MDHPRVILRKTAQKQRESDFWTGLRGKAAEKKRTILFPESTDLRVLSAVSFLAERGIVRPVLAGPAQAVRDAAKAAGISVDKVELREYGAARKEALAAKLFEKRKAKGMTPEEAAKLVEDPLTAACLDLAEDGAHGLVAGAVRTTADTVRAGFSSLGLAPGASTVFGMFLMDCPHATAPAGSAAGERPAGRILAFADSAVSPDPSARALAAAGVEAARLFRFFTGETPRVAYLSFSTRGSAEHESATKMREAAALARKKAPELAADGELQGDAALVKDIAAQKGAGDSPVAGTANVLIFPDLNAGNGAYKLVQHLGGARAVGPLLPGLAKPFSDLSRGCNDEDVVDAAALVALL